MVAVFLIAQLAAVVYDPYPGPSVALDVCACPQFMPIKQKSVREPQHIQALNACQPCFRSRVIWRKNEQLHFFRRMDAFTRAVPDGKSNPDVLMFE